MSHRGTVFGQRPRYLPGFFVTLVTASSYPKHTGGKIDKDCRLLPEPKRETISAPPARRVQVPLMGHFGWRPGGFR